MSKIKGIALLWLGWTMVILLTSLIFYFIVGNTTGLPKDVLIIYIGLPLVVGIVYLCSHLFIKAGEELAK